ncbi:helix-turn-helix transcriptional regulator [Salipaludibacillus agaradhaerens]|jgi:transcriptional regulator with XRE-family HTH domain|uniref:helix-turn-helix domain-containing protein n=1 Tax=Salipaludibacillus TaxID=1884449 RepID=UPI0020D157B1|nr:MULTISPECIES: helix-turn-helix transcriptional regulator [Salipaludibacillus]MCR6116612.1 helix-turn-helix transcriptional regulator [Salipaludibacillus agaradhaerens]UTR13450.1 helix-turn-helix transcriptional regulator [Salipaludibacillus sp. LMS25]
MLKDKLVQLRKRKKKTQQDIADIIGVTRPAYTAYEKGNRTPDYDIIKKLADYFDVTTDYLLGRSDHPELTAEDDEKSFDYYKSKIAKEFPDIDLMFKDMESLSAEDMKEVYEYIKFKMSQKKDD